MGRGAAEKAWDKIKPDKALVERMLEAVSNQRESEQWLKDNGRFIPNPATWLNQERWKDELAPMWNDPTDEEIDAWNAQYKARQQEGKQSP